MIPKIMNEKELVITLAEDNEDVDLLLSALNENAKGNFQFKKMKLRRLVKKDISVDLLGFLMDKLDRPEINEYRHTELPILLKQLIAEGYSKMWQYLIVTKFHHDFTKENFKIIIENAKGGNEPFLGLHGFDNDRDLELFYKNEFAEVQKVKDESEVDHIMEWFEETIRPLEIYKKRLLGVDLTEFDRLVGAKNIEAQFLISPDFLKREECLPYNSKHVTKAALSDLVKAVDGEGVKLALYLAYLEVGLYNEGIKLTLLDTMHRHHLTFRMQLMSALKIVDDMIFIGEHKRIVADYDELEKKLKKVEADHERFVADLNQQLERAQVASKRSEDESVLIQNEFTKLKHQHLEEEQRTAGYTRMLSDNFVNLKMMVVHDTQLLYAPVIYPDVSFRSFEELTETGFADVKVVLIQVWGSSVKKMRQLESAAREVGCEVLLMHCSDERQLIMEMAHEIKERRAN